MDPTALTCDSFYQIKVVTTTIFHAIFPFLILATVILRKKLGKKRFIALLVISILLTLSYPIKDSDSQMLSGCGPSVYEKHVQFWPSTVAPWYVEPFLD
ncbi:MAG: hypothetical protein ABIA47_00565 [bacterium]